jgi:putative N6-adenine-specific DNA methylase
MQWTFEKSGRFYAQCADGLEDLARAELESLGAEKAAADFRGVRFSAGIPSLYRINYCTRLCSRILAPLLTFDCHSTKYLYKTALEMDWEAVFDVERTFAISSNVSESAVRHSQYAALCLKDAIADHFRGCTGRRPDVEKITPDVWIDLHIHRNRATISLDTSGGSLHRRGYRTGKVKAPIQETVAAAMLEMSEWDGSTPLRDPMCGSGTILAEALMRCSMTPAGYLRERFGFENMPGFDATAWAAVRRTCDSLMRKPADGKVAGGDADPLAAAAARTNLSALPWGQTVRVESGRFEDHDGFPGMTVVTNPPYGLRLGERGEAESILKSFGDFLKRRCDGARAFVYFGDRGLIGSIGLRPGWRKPLRNGQLDGRLAFFEIHGPGN